MKKIKKLSSGFTLVELLLYMAIMVVFLGVLTNIFVSILDSKAESEATSYVEQDGRFILSRLTYDIGRASLVSVSSPTNLSLTISGPADIYTLSGNDLTLDGIKLNGSETKISNLTFQKLGNAAAGSKQTVQIKFMLTSVTQRNSGQEVRNYQTTVGTR
ncbi:prepilin-type N-terminal cleavage/methylation domain-containing protein [Candidatus Woesebacteria bacterium]|nr:prepilin-type N-terminal cleavage/methylation domain-containing protein [Candidatus Woesebacteria bacterium]